jgi:hypothetical protein
MIAPSAEDGSCGAPMRKTAARLTMTRGLEHD